MGAVAGGVAGGVGASKGTPDNVSYQNVTSKKTFDPASQTEATLQQNSLQQYLQQLQQLQGMDQRIQALSPLEQQAQSVYGDVLSGNAYNLTPGEEQRIQGLRDAMVQQGQGDINNLLDQRLRQVVSGAAGRGLRGQALGALQGQVLDAGSRSLQDIINNANTQAGQLALQLPQQRIQSQQGYAQTGLTMADNLRQQAIQNRVAAQNPYLLSLLNQERLAGGTTTASTQNLVPGRKASTWDIINGIATGGYSGANQAMNLLGSGVGAATGMQNFGSAQALRNGAAQPGYYDEPVNYGGQPYRSSGGLV